MTSFKLVTFASDSTIEDNRYLKKCIYQFHRAHKFYGNASVEIRVFQGAKEMGNQWIPFHQNIFQKKIPVKEPFFKSPYIQ